MTPKQEKEIEVMLKDIGFPTLSKLIHACGNGFSLERQDRYREKTEWIARTIFATGRGKIPEIAVANLYKKLNKK